MSSDDEKIEDLIDSYESALATGELVNVDELCRDCPELAETVRQRIQRLFKLDQFLEGNEVGDEPDNSEAIQWIVGDNDALPAGRYRPEAFHARGALGEVFHAKDEELDRQVVLKRINPLQAQFEENCRRFETEARITGRLEHPGVVPVYGLGHDSNGKPVYAMRFIDGQNLATAIDRFHDEAEQPICRTNVAFLQLLQRFVSLCQTVAYAHSRGIIHRDIKPANVMLGKYGETLLVDWGLAKDISDQKPSSAFGDPGLSSDRSAERGETAIGVVKGSPAYMSPEQADGRRDLVGPSSDIYNLGASLFHLLTGRRPYSGETKEIIQRVINGDCKHPRAINPKIPPAVEAICVKAMAHDITDRYHDAKALASDIERWIADEPVTSYHEPLLASKLRWLRRHRALASAFTVGTFVLLASLAFANWMLSEKNQLLSEAKKQTDEALQQTQNEREKAETSLKQALGAVHSMLLRIGRNEVTQIPEMQKVRQEMLEDAVQFLQGFVGFEDRPELVREQALAFQYLGKVQALLGEPDAAARSFRQAIARQQRMVRQDPHHLEVQQDLGLSWHELGRLLIFSDSQSAEHALTESVRQIESLERRLVGFELPLAEALNQLGTLYSNTNRPKLASESYHRSLRIREDFLADADESDQDACRVQLARSYHNLGTFELTRGDVEAAEKLIKQADAILQEEPNDSVMRRSFRNSRYEVCNSLASIAFEKREFDDAISEHLRALEVAKERANLYPNVASYQDSIARTHHNLANVYMSMQRKHDCLREFQTAVKIRRPLADGSPNDTYLQTVFAESCAGLAHVLSWNGDFQQAQTAYREALTSLKQLANEQPNLSRYASSLCSCEINYGTTLAKMGNIDESVAVHQQAIDRARAELEKDPGNIVFRQNLLNAHGARANTLITQQRFAEAIVDCDGVVAASDPKDREHWIAWRLPTLARLDHQRAYQDVLQLSQSSERSPAEYYNLSCSCAIAIQTVRSSSLPEDEKQKLQQTLRAKAFEMVEQTISQGFFTSPEKEAFLASDTDFDELRSDPRWLDVRKRVTDSVKANQQN